MHALGMRDIFLFNGFHLDTAVCSDGMITVF